MKKGLCILVLFALLIVPVSAQQSENWVEFRVDPDSWYGFYIHASEDTTIILNLNVTAGGEAHLFIVDEEDFDSFRVNGTDLQIHESHHFTQNLTLNFLVPYSGRWYFMFWSFENEPAKQIQGVVIPSPDGFDGDNSRYIISLVANIMIVTAIVVPLGVCIFLVIRRPKPSISEIDE